MVRSAARSPEAYGLLIVLDDANGSRLFTVSGDLHTHLQKNSQLGTIRENSVGLLIPGEAVAKAGLARKVALPHWADSGMGKVVRMCAVRALQDFTGRVSARDWQRYRDQIVGIGHKEMLADPPSRYWEQIAGNHLPGIICTTKGKLRSSDITGTIWLDDVEQPQRPEELFLADSAGAW